MIKPLPPFRPLPLLGDGHVQTVLGAYWPSRGMDNEGDLRMVKLDDGDAIALWDSVPARWQPGGWAVLIVPGLGGSSESGYVRRLGLRLYARGWRVLRLELRGTGIGLKHAARSYHVGMSGDLRAVLTDLARLAPGTQVAVVGSSLGGNQTLKLAIEDVTDPVPGLCLVAAVCPPINPASCCDLLEKPGNLAYDRNFVRMLTRLMERRRRHYPDSYNPTYPPNLTLRQFDDIHTAHVHGYRDAADYYAQNATAPHLHTIRVPALVLAARDDPFIDAADFDALRVPGHIRVDVTDGGGHLGFIGFDGAGGLRWADRRVELFLRYEALPGLSGGYSAESAWPR